MKKHILLLISLLFMLSACNTVTVADPSPYTIDQAASAAAPWKIGKKVVKGLFVVFDDSIDPASYKHIPAYRVFLGITPSGHYVVQEFYTENNAKATNPYQVFTQEGVTKPFCDFSVPDEPCGPQGIEGEFISWYPNGQKESHIFYSNGKLHGKYLQFYDNGQKAVEFDAEYDEIIGDLHLWSYEGYTVL